MSSFSFKSLRSSAILQGSAVVFLGSMGANVMAWLFHLLVASILGRAQYGEFSALLSLFYILNTPTIVLQTVVVKFFSVLKAKKATGEAKSLFLFFTKGMVAVSVVGFGIMLFLQQFLASFLQIQSPEYFLWLYGIFVFYLLGIINLSILQAYQKFFLMMVFANISGFFRLVLGVAFAHWGVGWTLISNIFSNILGYVALFVPLRFLFAVKAKPHSFSHSQTLGYSVPTFLALAGITAFYTQDVLWVKHFFSADTAGIYASLSVLGKVIFFASSAFAGVAFPMIAERKEMGKSSVNVVLLAVGLVASISFGLTAGYFLFPSLIIKILLGKAFVGAGMYLGMFGVFMAFFSLCNLMVNVLLALGKTRVWVFSVVGAGVQSGLLFFSHTSLSSIIITNATVTGVLFGALLVYYRYVER